MCLTLRWLGRTTLALLLLVAVPQSARASFIDLVSQNYLIRGTGYGSEGIVLDYIETSNTPISRSDFVLIDHGGGNVGGVFVSTSADGGITPSSAFVQASSNHFGLHDGAGDAAATAAITFRPLVSGVGVQPSGGLGFAGIYDLSVGAAVLALGSPIGPVATYNISLELDHLYLMYASVNGPGRDVKLSIVPTPESGSTLTFFVVGLGALLLVARSPTFRSSN